MGGPDSGNRYLIWDFDGTLAFRRGTWSECLRDAALRVIPQLGVTAEQLRPHLQASFPWHTPELVNAGIKTAEQ
jgi:putative hydrolase of the HAD superfamily